MTVPPTEHPVSDEPSAGARPAPSRAGRAAFLTLGAACFAYLYYRLDGAAAREDLSPEDLEREPKAGGLFSIDLDVGGFKMHRFGG